MSRPRLVSDELAQELFDLHRDGVSYRNLAAKYSLSFGAVRGAVNSIRNGVASRPFNTKFSETEIREVVYRWTVLHQSKNKISEEMGTHTQAFEGCLESQGYDASRRYSTREHHPNWKGGRWMDPVSGYMFVRVYPEDEFYPMSYNGRVQEHRYVMAKKLGRLLDPSETVHHINGVKDDNSPENLQLRQGKHGRGVVYVCLDCSSHNVSPHEL